MSGGIYNLWKNTHIAMFSITFLVLAQNGVSEVVDLQPVLPWQQGMNVEN